LTWPGRRHRTTPWGHYAIECCSGTAHVAKWNTTPRRLWTNETPRRLDDVETHDPTPRAHKLRLALTALAVVLACLHGGTSFSPIAQKRYQRAISQTSADAARWSRPRPLLNSVPFGRPMALTLNQSNTRQVGPGAAADGAVDGQVTLVQDGKVIKTKRGAPRWPSLAPDRQLSSLTLRQGGRRRSGEVVVTRQPPSPSTERRRSDHRHRQHGLNRSRWWACRLRQSGHAGGAVIAAF